MKKYEKLKMLLQHLETGKMLHENFNFNMFNNINIKKSKIRNVLNCGTCGCALGEMPILDKDFKFDAKGNLKFKKQLISFYFCENVLEYFELAFIEFIHLFYPNQQKTDWYGGKDLSKISTKSEVINNIKEFLKIKENENT